MIQRYAETIGHLAHLLFHRLIRLQDQKPDPRAFARIQTGRELKTFKRGAGVVHAISSSSKKHKQPLTQASVRKTTLPVQFLPEP